MNVDHRELQAETRYHRVLEIKHAEILWFIRDNLKPRGFPLFLFYFFNLVLVLGFIYTIIRSVFIAEVSFFHALSGFLIGAVLFLLILIPIHELLHLVAFRSLGAKETKVFAQWDKFLFYAVADKFVMNYKEFLFLALLPFVVLNGILLLLLFIVGDTAIYGVWAALIFHSTGCIGDFVLIDFLSEKAHRKFVNYDDLDQKITLFYAPKITETDSM
jgi:hypothetical protein